MKENVLDETIVIGNLGSNFQLQKTAFKGFAKIRKEEHDEFLLCVFIIMVSNTFFI